MPRSRNTLLRIRVVDPRGNFLGGTVDLDLTDQSFREQFTKRGVDASREIKLRGLRRRGGKEYRITVTPAAGFKPQSQLVRIPPSGLAALDFVFPAEAGDQPLPFPPRSKSANYIVTGRVSSPGSAGILGLRVQIVDRNVTRDIPIVEATTDERGFYQVQFPPPPITDRGKPSLDLQARVLIDEKILAVSRVAYDAKLEETLDVVLPAGSEGLSTEFDALKAAVSSYFDGNLRDLEESDIRQDLTYLANKTGWDARAVALAALADQFSQIRSAPAGAESLPPQLYYALFRAGLPADENALFQIDTGTARRVWKAALEQGVLPPAFEDQLDQAAGVFQNLSAERLLTVPLPIGTSSLSEMLQVAKLDQEQQQQFASLYTAHRTDFPALWNSVAETLGQEVSKRLQVSGRIAALTLNNAPLMSRVADLRGEDGVTDTAQLAEEGLYKTSQWEALLDGIVVPDQIPGENEEEKKTNFAKYLGAQVRLSYPTASVANMVKTGDLAVKTPDKISQFLTVHQGKFEIGAQPIEQYIAQNDLQVARKTVNEIKRLQRVYQMTPSDRAMSSLLGRGVDSAYQVVRYGRDAFARDFAADMDGEEQALQVYDKAAQVYNAVLNVAVNFLLARNSIALGATPTANGPGEPDVMAGPSGRRGFLQPAFRGPSADIIAYPTLEGLFGSLDFCECEECRSILSPAAYLVDLLYFLDQPSPPAGSRNPLNVLLDRRPDIQHLPLTCENTLTPLPYIDVVNETLEYFISNDIQKFSLDGYEGHDTGGIASVDLLASPQFIIDSAYETLRRARFPTRLPFHRSLENLRRIFEKFEVPLTLAMERFRAHDKFESGAAPYGWQDILMEEIGVCRTEYAILSDSGANPLWRIYGFPNGTSDQNVIAELSNARDFARRLDLQYTDLISLLKTRFINPNRNLIPKLERLGVDFSVLADLKDGSISGDAFDALLPTGPLAPDPADYGGNIQAWVTDAENFARIMGLIVLTDPAGDSDPCSFANLEFRHAEPVDDAADTSTRLTAVEFSRILRFIRLWKRTKWTIEQTDAAICALFNADLGPELEVDTREKLDEGFSILLPRLGILRRVMKALNLTVSRDLMPLLAVWSPITVHGDSALYRQLFLNPALLKQDAAFDDNGFGEFLQDENEKLLDHAEALRTAFNLTDDEFDRIIADLKFTDETKLNIENVSAIFRRGWLARKLAISVRELLLISKLTGLDPFTPPDLPDPAIMRLISLVKNLKERSLKTAVGLYVIWNQDLSGNSAPDREQVLELARTLRGDFAAIEEEFAVSDDSPGNLARTRMELVYGTEATSAFFAILNDTLPLDVPYTNPQPQLKKAIVDADPSIKYDHFRHLLSYSGVLTEERRDALKAIPSSANFKRAVDELFNRSEDVTGSFFGRYPELKPLFEAYVASPDPQEEKDRDLLEGIQPDLVLKRKRQQALQRLTADAGVELPFTQVIVDPPSKPYPLHAIDRPNRPVILDVLGLEKAGLGVQFFFRNTATGAVDLDIAAEANLSYSPGGRNPLPTNPGAGANISGIWSGLVEAPESGFYNFVIEADPKASVSLNLDGQDLALTQRGRVWRNTDPIEFIASTLHEIKVTVEKVQDRVSILWETADRPRQVIPARYLYPPDFLNPFSNAYLRFLKTASLAEALEITGDEMAFFAVHRDYEVGGDGWLNVLAVNGDPDPATAAKLLAPLEALLAFSKVKSEISPENDSLLKVLRDPAAATADPDSLLFNLTRWDKNSLETVVAHFKKDVEDLGSFELFYRVYQAFSLTRLMGISGSAMIAAVTNDPSADTVRDLQGNLRARYDPADWRDLVQPINDTLRGLQRDALVAYVLHHLRSRPATSQIDTLEKLFEFFLMDVGMEPCVQTSRIRHALSSVQLFIERCLMNLEEGVSPDALNSRQWEWMKRYRVWEANRKVFLFPENWAEPELRTDKSPFFKEIESELLQNDITEDAAAVAILNYLGKLEEVAKLQICGLYYVEENPALRTGDVVHVVGRTPGTHRKYFYRRREGGFWTAWEQIKLDIEDTPVIPVVWDGRLLLFWLQIMREGPSTSQKPGGSKDLIDLTTDELPSDPQVRTKAILGWSEYFNSKWQPAKTSEVALTNEILTAAEQEGTAFLRKNLTLSVSESGEKLRVNLNYQGSTRSSFILYNTYGSPVREIDEPSTDEFSVLFLAPFRAITPSDISEATNLEISYYSPARAIWESWFAPMNRSVLEPDTQIGVVTPQHPVGKPFTAPFFMEDKRHAFFVTSRQEPRWIGNTPGFGIAANPGIKEKVEIPPLIVQPERVFPETEFWGGTGPINPDPGVVDPVETLHFVTEDVHIQHGLGTTGSVSFQGKQIGPSGSIGAFDVRGIAVRRKK